jgi:hypothetical protein
MTKLPQGPLTALPPASEPPHLTLSLPEAPQRPKASPRRGFDPANLGHGGRSGPKGPVGKPPRVPGKSGSR